VSGRFRAAITLLGAQIERLQTSLTRYAGSMEFDPYRPPSVDAQALRGDAGTGEPLFTTQHVTLATFFGTPLAGFVLMGLNETRMGRPGQMGKMIGFGIVASAVVLAIALVVPDEFPSFVITLGSVFGMQAVAKQMQGEEVMERLSKGVPAGSGWHAFGIGLLCLVPIIAVAFGIGLFFPSLIS
jgi:hypothetical protein